jgi:hypothetical protein
MNPCPRFHCQTALHLVYVTGGSKELPVALVAISLELTVELTPVLHDQRCISWGHRTGRRLETTCLQMEDPVAFFLPRHPVALVPMGDGKIGQPGFCGLGSREQLAFSLSS